MGMSPALAKKIAEATTSVRGVNIKDGGYILLVKRLLCEQKFKGTFFIGEFRVVESEVTEEGVTPNKPGTDCSVAFQIDAAGERGSAALANAKNLLAGIGLDIVDADAFMQKAIEYTDDKQPARGMLVQCQTYRSITQRGPNAGKTGTYPRFSPLGTEDGNSAGEVRARRVELDGK